MCARYFVVRHENTWSIKLDDEEFGPYRSQSEAVSFAIEAAEQHNRNGEGAEVVLTDGTSSLPTRMDLQPGNQPRVLVSMES